MLTSPRPNATPHNSSVNYKNTDNQEESTEIKEGQSWRFRFVQRREIEGGENNG